MILSIINQYVIISHISFNNREAEKQKKRKIVRIFSRYVLNNIFLRGRNKKLGKEAEVGRIYNSSYCPFFY
jgi:hypothetical protein